MNANYTKITSCPKCGSKHLTVSEYWAQIWNDRVLRGGKLSKGKRHTYDNAETVILLSCQDCDFKLESDDRLFQISEDGDILINDDYLKYLKKE
jgi:hypothetical protein